jgi:hypothetical protein
MDMLVYLQTCARISEQWNFWVEMGVAFAGDSYCLLKTLYSNDLQERFLVLGGLKSNIC